MPEAEQISNRLSSINLPEVQPSSDLNVANSNENEPTDQKALEKAQSVEMAMEFEKED